MHALLTQRSTEWELDMTGLTGEYVKIDEERAPTEYGYRSFDVTVLTGKHAGLRFLAYIEEVPSIRGVGT